MINIWRNKTKKMIKNIVEKRNKFCMKKFFQIIFYFKHTKLIILHHIQLFI